MKIIHINYDILANVIVNVTANELSLEIFKDGQTEKETDGPGTRAITKDPIRKT